MARLHVLLSEQGEIIGTARATGPGGEGGPDQATLRAGQGQRVLNIDVDEELLPAHPARLHTYISANFLG